MRLLNTFADPRLHGKAPQEPSAASSTGVRSYSETPQISIVDDDESVREATKTLLRSVGLRVATFDSAELFLDSGALEETECLILDVRMPGMDGLELQRRLRAGNSRVPVIFITAHDDDIRRRQAIEAGAVGFLRKPFDASALIRIVQGSLGARKEAC